MGKAIIIFLRQHGHYILTVIGIIEAEYPFPLPFSFFFEPVLPGNAEVKPVIV
jgi:hypothetical protein